MSKPVGPTLGPFQVQQGRLNLPFPAVQGTPIEDTCPNGQGMF
ncbi:hypothetical protein [Desulfovibrio intestinalis]|uniref:Uncharacterized protein n=1 Tax=Desulfovibrio intestinalis TaxID=58621 RepID=A0A7W8FFQ9_9BACT|nr:hypothetical protein [Desulfovibrio intestinalis]MBB5141992.1 hypothetical protein [Desulfovibrio intestinalis]